MSDLQQPPGASPNAPKPDSRKAVLVAVGALLLAALGALGAYFLLGRQQPAAPATPPVQPMATAPSAAEPQDAAETPSVPLPPLGQSDARVRELVGPLSSQPEMRKWLASTEDMVRRFATAVSNISEGESPRAALTFMAPPGAFQTVEREGRTVIAPESFARYEPVTRVLTSLDPQGSARAYKVLRPLINEAYKEISRPGQSFDATLSRAIQKMLDTPVPEGDIEVVDTPGVNYVYAAPELEQLSAAQKHLLRMGPANARAVQTKLRELQGALALPSASR